MDCNYEPRLWRKLRFRRDRPEIRGLECARCRSELRASNSESAGCQSLACAGRAPLRMVRPNRGEVFW